MDLITVVLVTIFFVIPVLAGLNDFLSKPKRKHHKDTRTKEQRRADMAAARARQDAAVWEIRARNEIHRRAWEQGQEERERQLTGGPEA